jgi:hypothetical protein
VSVLNNKIHFTVHKSLYFGAAKIYKLDNRVYTTVVSQEIIPVDSVHGIHLILDWIAAYDFGFGVNLKSLF